MHFVETALQLFEPALLESVLVRTRGEELIASSAQAESLGVVSGILARLQNDVPARRWTTLAAEASASLTAPQPLATFLRLLTCMPPDPPVPARGWLLRGFSLVNVPDGWSVMLGFARASADGYDATLLARLQATGDAVTEAFGSPESATASAFTWKVAGANVALLIHREGPVTS